MGLSQPVVRRSCGVRIPGLGVHLDDRYCGARLGRAGESVQERIDGEAYYSDGGTRYETVYYVVLEKGVWHLDSGGAVLQVGSVETSAQVGTRISPSWEQIDFPKSFAQTPVILSQTQTASNYGQGVHIRQSNAGPTASGSPWSRSRTT